MPCTFQDAYQLLMEGSRAFAQVEANGMRLDVPYLDRMIEQTGSKIKEMESKIREDAVWKTWKKIYGDTANLSSDVQLGHIIFDVMKVPCENRTPSGRPATDAETLEKIDFPFIKRLNEIEKLRKARDTNLIGLRREQCGGILRGNLNLHTTITYRSSASDPNTQNIPKRDDRVSKLVRRAFIPRSDDFVLFEMDMKGAEVRVSACYNEDPNLIKYILEGYDFHRALAMQCYCLDADQVTDGARNEAKADFVFASFYGSWFVEIAKKMWDAIGVDGLKTVAGVDLREHLREHRIFDIEDFTKHIESVYDDFWGVRFKRYAEWKEEWWREYLKKGMYQTLTGFVCRGIYERNKAINYPIQGSSFHCLLWVLIQMQGWLVKNKMRSMIIGQIHDSIIMDVHRKEFDYVMERCGRLMLHDIRKAWDWITIPLDADSTVGENNWYATKKIKIAV